MIYDMKIYKPNKKGELILVETIPGNVIEKKFWEKINNNEFKNGKFNDRPTETVRIADYKEAGT